MGRQVRKQIAAAAAVAKGGTEGGGEERHGGTEGGRAVMVVVVGGERMKRGEGGREGREAVVGVGDGWGRGQERVEEGGAKRGESQVPQVKSPTPRAHNPTPLSS